MSSPSTSPRKKGGDSPRKKGSESPSSPRKKSGWVRGDLTGSSSSLKSLTANSASSFPAPPQEQAPVPPPVALASAASLIKFQTTRKKGPQNARVMMADKDSSASSPSASRVAVTNPALFAAPSVPAPMPPVSSTMLIVDCADGGVVTVSAELGSTVDEAVALVLEKLGAAPDTPSQLLANGVAVSGSTLVSSLNADAFLSLSRMARKAPSAFRRSVMNRRLSARKDESESTADAVFVQIVMPDKSQAMLKFAKSDMLESVKAKGEGERKVGTTVSHFLLQLLKHS
jgi:hypothetical protein